jgi:cation diffusion facilitator CzcD-associated flavoprotein CzcO/pimeloyl-ACP methyl ester carboxylesterase
MEHVSVAVVGAGFSGLGMAAGLRQAGVTDFTVLERAGSVGGIWRDNTYPGCRCDVPSHLYSFSFAPNPRWPRTYSAQPTIRAYLEEVTDRLGLRPHIRFDCELQEARWDSGRTRWLLRTARGQLSCDVLVAAPGLLSQPAVPDLPGLESFPGPVLHSARWDDGVQLAGRRVAVVGTGASAIQIVPEVQRTAERLVLFQRTPAWVLPARNRALRSWEHRLYQRVPAAQRAVRAGIYARLESVVGAFVRRPRSMRLGQRLALAHLHRQVQDPVLRAKLTPSYILGCKRILLSNDYYPALTRPNVELVASGLAEVRGSTVVASDGTEREVDVIIFGTGFHVGQAPILERLYGRDGQALAQLWARSAQALRGTTIAGFPNLFVLIGPNTGLGHNSMIFIIESQVAYVLDCLRRMRAKRLAAVEPTAQAQERWNTGVQRRMAGTVWSVGGCSSWYTDSSGRNTTLWPASSVRFRRETRRVDLGEYRVTRTGERPAEPAPPRPAARRRTGRSRYQPILPVPADRRLEVRSADGTRLHVEVHGPEDAPTVVLVHGWTCSTAFWAPVARRLGRDLRVVTYDQRGHGASGVPGRDAYSTDALADDLAAVLAACVPPDERAVVAGHSMGGMTVLAAAARPAVRDRLAAVLLASTGSGRLLAESMIVPLPERYRRTRQVGTRLLLGSALPLGPVTPVSRRILRFGTMGPGAGPAEVAFCAQLVHACPGRVRARWAAVLRRLDLDAAVAELTVPTTVLVGTRDRMTPPVHSRRIAERLPNLVELVELDRIGHMSPVEAPDAVGAAIERLVREHVAAGPSGVRETAGRKGA